MRRAVVVAHPDDESIFCGGLLARYAEDWTVIACSVPLRDGHPLEEIDRGSKFYFACEVLGAKRAEVLAFPEKNFQYALPLLGTKLDGFDHIITHNQVGEYGHEMHFVLHRYIKQHFADRKLTFFGYMPGRTGKHKISLTDEELATKMNAIRQYNHRNDHPYWKVILAGCKTWPGFKLEQESYDGYWPW